jgi:hypothetical protein
MFYTTKDLQGRVNALNYETGNPFEPLVLDGMSGPKTRRVVASAMKLVGVTKEKDLFHDSGLMGVVWHWTAGRDTPTKDDLSHYNGLSDYEGNHYDGGARPEHQSNYDWRKKIGVSHTKNMNTGWIGEGVAGMKNAKGWPSLKWGSHPVTWEGIDSMLEWTAIYNKRFWIPNSPWSNLSHAEVQGTMNVKQNNKWDYMVLPGDTVVRTARMIGNILRQRLKDRF